MRLNISMLYDMALMLIFIFIVWRGWRQGVLSELLRLAGWAAALVLVAIYSAPWAERLYHAAVEPRALSAVAAAIPADVLSAMENGAEAVQSLQAILNSLNGIFGGQVIDDATATAIVNMLRQDAGSLAQIVTQTVLQPMLIPLVQALLSVALLSGCLWLSRTLARLVAAKKSDGILSMTNRLLGMVLGVGEGLVSAYVYVFLLSLAAVFVNTSWLSQDVLRNGVVVSLFM